MNSFKKSKLIVFLLTFSIAGCGGGSQGTGAFDSGFAKNAKVSEFTEKDREQLCNKYFDYTKEQLKKPDVFCPLIGLVSKNDPDFQYSCEFVTSVCIDSYNDLKQTVDEVFESGEFSQKFADCPLSLTNKLNNCLATVSQIETCIVDYVDTSSEVLSSLQCSEDLSKDFGDKLSKRVGDIKSLAGCQPIVSSCPSFFK
jgi:hypothetical protein